MVAAFRESANPQAALTCGFRVNSIAGPAVPAVAYHPADGRHIASDFDTSGVMTERIVCPQADRQRRRAACCLKGSSALSAIQGNHRAAGLILWFAERGTE
jgi:hypothetical protein